MKNTKFGYNFGDITTIPEVPEIVVESTIKHILTFVDKPLKNIIVLDIGSGRGIYTRYLAKRVKKVIAVEPYNKAHKFAVKNNNSKNTSYVNCKIENLKTNYKFDLAISLTTLEHMPDSYKSFKKVFSLLKKDGILYLTAPNKLWPYEAHYKLLFLSYLPVGFANAYLSLSGKGKSYEECSYSKTYWGVKKFFQQFPCTYRFILPTPDAEYLGVGNDSKLNNALKSFGIMLIRRFPIFWGLSKGFIVVAKKVN